MSSLRCKIHEGAVFVPPLASPEIGAKTNEIPEFAPLLDQIDDADLAGWS
ncbi:hypothetical protein [Streptomyces sp. NPDC001714]